MKLKLPSFLTRKPAYDAAPLSADYEAGQKALAMVNNMASSLRDLDTLVRLGVSHEGARNLDLIYGYKTNGRSYQDYFDRYRFTGWGSRVVKAPAKSCWREGATIEGVDSDGGAKVLLEPEMERLAKQGLFKALERADILNRIGSFSVLFVGLPGDDEFTEPIQRGGGKIEDVYFSPFSQDSVQITEYDHDEKSPRYGLPLEYTLTPGQNRTGDNTNFTDVRQATNVHWSRVVHLAEGALDNSLVGVSSLDPVFNRIDDLNKTAGGAAEAFFRNCMQKLAISMDKDIQAADLDLVAIQAAIEKFINEQQNYILLQGGDVNAIPVEIADPTSTYSVAIKEISAETGIPERILTGEGGGQLKGTEDKATYNQMISDRQEHECAPWLIDVLEILDVAGIISLPKDFVIGWPVPTAMDEKTAAEVELANARAVEALSKAMAVLEASLLITDEQVTAIGQTIERLSI